MIVVRLYRLWDFGTKIHRFGTMRQEQDIQWSD
jgi:hypothetical protein